MELLIIQKKIFEIRGERVMLDLHLAELYGVETKMLKRAVKRNMNRFPPDFMFQLTKSELENLRYQFGTSSWGGSRYLPYAFTEHGITMLSNVLRSSTAIDISITVVRAFILLKQYNNNYKLLQQRIDELEVNLNRKIENINEVIDFLLTKPEPVKTKPRRKIGFKLKKNKK